MEKNTKMVFNWTENFDGKIEINNKLFFINFKFVCDNGGAQTRTLREVNLFIKTQNNFLEKFKYNYYFLNILDGDNCYKHINKIKNGINNKNIFIGDLNQFQKYFYSVLKYI